MGPGDLTSLLAGAAEAVPAAEFEAKLELGRPLRVKLGLDPTAPAVTLGWAVVLRKLRQFQDAGHVAVLIVGDFTGRVGDPSGRSETRPRLSKQEVQSYAARLLDQFWMVLDQARTEVRYNSEWLEPLDMEAILRLTASATVARMLERDDFAIRYAQGKPISILEFLYPLLQAMDSVAVESDVELGGTDQKFNLLMGRDLQRAHGQEPQVALTMPLLVGTDGVQKMSQSLGNYVGMTEEPDAMFGKLVRIPDEMIGEFRRLSLDFFSDPAEADRVTAGLGAGSLEPWAEKRRLAREVVDLYHGAGEGAAAEQRFDRIHRGGGVPDEIREVSVPRTEVFIDKDDGVRALDNVAMLVHLGLARTRSEARRLIDQRGAKRDGEQITDPDARWAGRDEELVGTVWQVGRRRFARVARLI